MNFENTGNMVSNAPQREHAERAMHAARTAIDLSRQLAQISPDVSMDVAKFQNILGLMLSELGRREEACKAAQEACDLYRELRPVYPDFIITELPMSLSNLCIVLSELGRREEACKAAQGACDLYRKLAHEYGRRCHFLPDLAASLHNLGILLSELGRREEALRAVEEAADLYRKLVRVDPDAALQSLARCQDSLGAISSKPELREEDLKERPEGQHLTNWHRERAHCHADGFLRDLAMDLDHMGMWLSELGKREEALRAAHEVVDVCRDLARARPYFLPELGMSLSSLANKLSALDRREEALNAAHEAIELYGSSPVPDLMFPRLRLP